MRDILLWICRIILREKFDLGEHGVALVQKILECFDSLV
jgi:uncharacterized protein YheU (UPF0270 family)